MLKGSAVYHVISHVLAVRGHASNCHHDKFCQKKVCLVSICGHSATPNQTGKAEINIAFQN